MTETPLHGYRGLPTPPPMQICPAGPVLTMSREAGARGGTIAQAVAASLGWELFTQDMIDFMSQDELALEKYLADLDSMPRLWAHTMMEKTLHEHQLTVGSELAQVQRTIFSIAARGRVVLIGRGAGFFLPRETTLSVRIVSPLPIRVKYMSQRLRMTEAEAREEVAKRDQSRANFLQTFAKHDIADPANYDLILNPARLGIETCVDVIHQGILAKTPKRDE